MKCPKCGSKMIKRPSLDVYSCTNGKCYNNESIADMEELEWVSPYQQRLDNVLSKFDFFKGDEYVYKNIISYFKNTNDFYISDDFPNLSLKTVESLLKDLEGNNE